MQLNERAAPIPKTAYGGDLAPPDVEDPLVEAFKKDVDRTLLIENLRLSVPQRVAKFQRVMDSVEKVRGAALPPELRDRILKRT